MHNDNSNTNH